MPDLKATKKKLISLPFASVEDGRLVADAEFASKLAKQVEEDALVILLDGSGALAPKAASLVSAAGVGAKVYTVREGFKAWEASDLPVRSLTAPLFSLPSLDLSGLGNLEELASRYRKDPNALNTLMAAAAVAGGATLLLTEFETILELVGIVGAGKFLLDRLLFADERDKTLKEVK